MFGRFQRLRRRIDFGLGRQGRGAVCGCPQIGDQICAVLDLLDAGEGHLGAGDVILRLGEKRVQAFIGPAAGFFGQCLGIGKSVNRAALGVDDVPQIRADLVLAVFLHVVTGPAFRRDLLARRRIGRSQQTDDGFQRRLDLGRFGFCRHGGIAVTAAMAAAVSTARRDQIVANLADDHHGKYRDQNCTENFVEFE